MVVPCLLFIRYTYQQLIELFHQYRLLWEILFIFKGLAFNIFNIDPKHALWAHFDNQLEWILISFWIRKASWIYNPQMINFWG